MPFAPGTSGNPNGRPKGATGSVSTTVKTAIAEALQDRAGQIGVMLDKIESPIKWLQTYAKFAEFVIPKRQIHEKERPYEDWSDEELEIELLRLKREDNV